MGTTLRRQERNMLTQFSVSYAFDCRLLFLYYYFCCCCCCICCHFVVVAGGAFKICCYFSLSTPLQNSELALQVYRTLKVVFSWYRKATRSTTASSLYIYICVYIYIYPTAYLHMAIFVYMYLMLLFSGNQ